MKHLVGHAKNGIEVNVDLITSRAAKHISQMPHLLSLAAEALQSIQLEKTVMDLEYDMGRTIGYDFVVETTDTDTIFYVQLVRDNTYTRFTKNGKPLSTKYLSMILCKSDDDTSYDLLDIWVGRLTPPRPGSDQATDDAKTYWEKHAFVFENQPVQSSTLTKTCPY